MYVSEQAKKIPMFDAFGRQINVLQMEPLRADLIKQAEDAHAPYPQYKGHWQLWVVCLVKKNIRTKMGLVFQKGDVVLCKPEIRDISKTSYAKKKDKRSVTCYSWRSSMNTSVWLDEVKVDSTNFPTIVES